MSFFVCTLPGPSPLAAAEPASPTAAPSPPAVGVLLPLSGRYQSFGEPCLRGIRLALGAAGAGSPVLRTVVLDTRGDGGEAETAFKRLAADPGIVAILGPMLAWELDRVRPLISGLELPAVTFSQKALPSGAPWLRFSMSKEDQTKALARYGVVTRALRRWAIFHPEDGYGRELSALFREQVEALGGRVVANVGYDPAQTDFQADVARLRARVGAVADQLPPLDGVFLPDSAERIVLVVPHLALADIRGVQLLGPSAWNRPEILLKGMPYVEGAVFVDGFFLHSFLPQVRSFVDAYRDVYNADPAILDAYGYDAASLVKEGILAGAADRRRLREWLRRPMTRTGATGPTRFSGDGAVEPSLFFLKVEDGTVHEVEVSESGR